MEEETPVGKIYRFAESSEKSATGRGTGIARLEDALHFLRDSDPFIYILDELSAELGLRYGDVVFNLPADAFVKAKPPAGPGFLGELTAKDLLVRTTRPTVPYSDKDIRHGFGRGGTPLEIALSFSDAEFFYYCNREEISLSQAIALEPQVRDRYRSVRFQQHGGARRIGGPFVGYVTFAPAGFRDVPSPVVNVFSTNGTSTLVWAYLLTRVLRGPLASAVAANEPSLTLCEFQVGFPDRIERLCELTFSEVSLCRQTFLTNGNPGVLRRSA